MKSNWSKKEKIADMTPTMVMACSTLTIQGVANGRTIPVIFVEKDDENKIETAINLHKNVKQGICSTQWGATEDNKYVLLFLKFSLPTETNIVLMFDILKHGYIVTHILKMQCLYLAMGDEGSKLSENMDAPKILIEVKNEEFLEEWYKIFQKEYTKHLRKKHGLSKKEAVDIFEKITKEISIIEKIRL